MDILRQILIELVTLFQENLKIVTKKHNFVTPYPKNTNFLLLLGKKKNLRKNCDKIFHLKRTISPFDDIYIYFIYFINFFV
jgi:hypothetical protein